MMIGRLIGVMLACLVSASAAGCASESMPSRTAPPTSPPVPVQVEPSQIFNDATQSP